MTNASKTSVKKRGPKKGVAVPSGAALVKKTVGKKAADAKEHHSLALVPRQKTPSSRTITPKQVVQATTAGGAALVAAHDPGTIPFLFLFGAYGVALSVGLTLALDALRPGARAYGARLAQGVAPRARDEESAALVLRDRLAASAPAQRAVLDGVRRLLDSVAEDAAIPLADLTAEYVNANKPPDWFFRGTARFLSDVSVEELSALRALLVLVSTDGVIEGREEVPFMYRPLLEDRQRVGPNRIKYLRTLPQDDARRPTTTSEWTALGVLASTDDPHVYRVIQQLKLNGLADDPPKGGFTGVSGKESFVVAGSVLRRLASLVEAT